MTNGYHEPTERMLDVDVLYHLKHYSELQSSHGRKLSCGVQGLAAKVTVTLPLHVACEKGCKGAQINQKTWVHMQFRDEMDYIGPWGLSRQPNK